MTQPSCRIELLGGLRVRHGAGPLVRVPVRKTGVLLGFLALHLGRPQTREELAEMLWPEETLEATRTRFRQLLSTLRRLLEATPDLDLLIADRTEVRLDASAVSTDLLDFEQALATAGRAADMRARAEALRRAIALYQGELLPGYYEEWVLSERRRLSDTYTEALGRLANTLADLGELEAAIGYGRRAVDEDPLREEAHCDLIRIYAAAGRPTDAMRQYGEMERLLQREVGLRPSSQAQALVAEIRASSSAHPRPAPVFSAPDAPPPPRDPGGAEPDERLTADPPPQARQKLPAPLTRFFGREHYLARLEALLGLPERAAQGARCTTYEGPPPGARLVTLTGPGGSGKTRLARELAARLYPPYRGAVWFVPLADLSQGRQVAAALLAALDARPALDADAVAQAAEILDRQPSLVILDNVEHLVEGAAPVIRDLLDRAPNVRCLVTSRQRLQIEGEHELPVLPLPIPEHPGTPERLLEFASVQLLLDRIGMVQPDFQVTSENAEAVAALCRSLEGIPLAIELAAARAQVLTPEQMLLQLNARFDFLVSRRTDIPARHRTLRAAMEWSFQLLPPDLQRFLARLTLFRGGWTLDSARAVCEQPEALNHLELLRERSLIVDEPQGAEMRFRMLETVRQYCLEQIDEAERRRACALHVDYFLTLAESAEAGLIGPDQPAWLVRLDAEHDNLLAALDACAEVPDGTVKALRLCAALRYFWQIRAYLLEGTERLATALARASEIGRTAEKAQALLAAGILNDLLMMTNLPDREYPIRTLVEESLAIWRELGDRRGIAEGLCRIAYVDTWQGLYDTARARYEEALELFRAVGDRHGVARALNRLGWLAYEQKDYTTARAHFDACIPMFRECGDRHGLAWALNAVGKMASNQRDWPAAIPAYEECLALARSISDKPTMAHALANLSYALRQLGDSARSWALEKELAPVCRDIGSFGWEAISYLTQANLALAARDWEQARADYAQCLDIVRRYHIQSGVSRHLMGLALIAAEAGDWSRAAQLWGAAEADIEDYRWAERQPPRIERDAEHARIRQALGDAEFDRAWKAGHSLSRERAIEYALGRAYTPPDPLR